MFSTACCIVKTQLKHSAGIRDWGVEKVLANFFQVPASSIWIEENERNDSGSIIDFSLHVFIMNSNKVAKFKSSITSESFLKNLTTDFKKEYAYLNGEFDYSSHPSTEEIEGNIKSSS